MRSDLFASAAEGVQRPALDYNTLDAVSTLFSWSLIVLWRKLEVMHCKYKVKEFVMMKINNSENNYNNAKRI